MRASALVRSVMSSSSSTVPPPVIGWNVQASVRPREVIGSAVTISQTRASAISARIRLPLSVEIEPADTQADTMSAAVAPRLTRSSGKVISSLKRWFITARRPSARNMHRPCGMLLRAVSN